MDKSEGARGLRGKERTGGGGGGAGQRVGRRWVAGGSWVARKMVFRNVLFWSPTKCGPKSFGTTKNVKPRTSKKLTTS